MTFAKYYFLICLFITPVVTLTAQSADTLTAFYYKEGLTALNKKDYEAAKNLFKKSISEKENAPAEYELAKILVSKNSIEARNEARDLMTRAIFADPNNIKYHLLMADLWEYISDELASIEYENILKIDSTNIIALLQLGKMKEKHFEEYNNSFLLDDPSNPMLNFYKLSEKYFGEAKSYFEKVLSVDSLNSQAILHLSFLNDDIKKPEKALPLLEKLVKYCPEDKGARLCLGVMYYKTSNLQGSYIEYQEALKLMDVNERMDFTFNSVKELIEPLFGGKMENYSDKELQNLINSYWTVKNPLFMSKYNARLLEHYTSVAEANLHF